LSLEQLDKIDLFCPIAPGTKVAQWSKYLSCSIVVYPLGIFCGTKSLLHCKRIKIFLVTPPKKSSSVIRLRHITFLPALNTWQKSHKVLQGGPLEKFSCALNRAMLYSMNMKKISSGPLTLYSLPQMKNCATRYRSYSTKLSVFRNRLHLAKALPLRFL